MDADEYKHSVENHIIDSIKLFLDEGSITPDRAKAIANSTIQALTPGLTVLQINVAIENLAQQFPELSTVSVSAKRDWDENAKSQTLPKIHDLLQQGNIEAADTLLKNALMNTSSTEAKTYG